MSYAGPSVMLHRQSLPWHSTARVRLSAWTNGALTAKTAPCGSPALSRHEGLELQSHSPSFGYTWRRSIHASRALQQPSGEEQSQGGSRDQVESSGHGVAQSDDGTGWARVALEEQRRLGTLTRAAHASRRNPRKGNSARAISSEEGATELNTASRPSNGGSRVRPIRKVLTEADRTKPNYHKVAYHWALRQKQAIDGNEQKNGAQAAAALATSGRLRIRMTRSLPSTRHSEVSGFKTASALEPTAKQDFQQARDTTGRSKTPRSLKQRRTLQTPVREQRRSKMRPQVRRVVMHEPAHLSPAIGTLTLPPVDHAGQFVREAMIKHLHPLHSSWCKTPKKRQDVLLLFTPTFVEQLTGTSIPGTLKSNAPLQYLNSLFRGSAGFRVSPTLQMLESMTVVVAIVDQLPGAAGGCEGMAWALVDELVCETSENEHAASTERFLTLRLDEEGSTANPSQMASYSVEIPLANTIFSSAGGFRSILASWSSSLQKEDVNGQLIPELNSYSNLSSVTAVLRTKALTNQTLELDIFTPLLPLTHKRQVHAAMGNIIRQLSDVSKPSEGLIPASQDLETAINSLVAQEMLPAGPVSVWALVSPGTGRWKRPDQGLGCSKWGLQAQLRSGNTMETLSFPDLTEILRSGGKLHKVVSGGGGWGKKAGLLSLSPAVQFHVSGTSSAEPAKTEMEGDEGVLYPPWMQEPTEQLEDALGSPIKRGDRIQFFIAVSPPKNHDHVPELTSADSSAQHHPSPIVQVAAIPSTMDIMPEVISSTTPAEHIHSQKAIDIVHSGIKVFPNFLGVLSEGGFAISGISARGLRARSMIDVPFARLRIGGDQSKNKDGNEVKKNEAAELRTEHDASPKSLIRKTRPLRIVKHVFGTRRDETQDQNEPQFPSANEAMARPIILTTEDRNVENADQIDSADWTTKLSEAQKEYVKGLETMSNDEIELEKERLAHALREAKLARRQATKALRETEMPVRAANGPRNSRLAALEELSFEELSVKYLQLKDELLKSKPGMRGPEVRWTANIVEFWVPKGFSARLVDLLYEYHTLSPELPPSAISHFNKSNGNSAVQTNYHPYADLRAAASRLSKTQEARMWRKWHLLKSIHDVLHSSARIKFREDLRQGVLREAVTQNSSPGRNAEIGDGAASNLIDGHKKPAGELTHDMEIAAPEFRDKLFMVLGVSLRQRYDKKFSLWERLGLPREARSTFWHTDALRKVLDAAIQWTTRLNYRTGDAVGAAIMETLGWNSGYSSKSQFYLKLEGSAPKFHVTYKTGDKAHLIKEAKGVKLLHTPDARNPLLSDDVQDDGQNSLSRSRPWEFLYHYLSVVNTNGSRSVENGWHIRPLPVSGFRDKLGPIFAKFDEAIAAHGDKTGLAHVDIGAEVREHFPHLLRTEAELRHDMEMSSTSLKLKYAPLYAQLTSYPSTPPHAQTNHRPVKPKSRRQTADGLSNILHPFFKSLRSSLRPSTPAPQVSPRLDFRSKWQTDPNTFAWELMEKQLRRKVQERVQERLAQAKGEEASAAFATSSAPRRRGEEDVDDVGVDYDLMERVIERRMDRRRIRQPSVKRLDLGQQDQGVEAWAEDEPYESGNEFGEIQERQTSIDLPRSPSNISSTNYTKTSEGHSSAAAVQLEHGSRESLWSPAKLTAGPTDTVAPSENYSLSGLPDGARLNHGTVRERQSIRPVDSKLRIRNMSFSHESYQNSSPRRKDIDAEEASTGTHSQDPVIPVGHQRAIKTQVSPVARRRIRRIMSAQSHDPLRADAMSEQGRVEVEANPAPSGETLVRRNPSDLRARNEQEKKEEKERLRRSILKLLKNL